MRDFYDVLEIDKNADEKQVKIAYFRLVRQYSPEKFPEEFKELRNAYETLSNAEKRAEYDMVGRLPDEAAYLYERAKIALKRGRTDDAIEMFCTILKNYPELDNIRVELAEIYLEEGKSGKAAKEWEYLCEKHPDNSEYCAGLARAYLERGWHKKAIAIGKQAVEMNPESFGAWSVLIGCYGARQEYDRTREACETALKVFEGKDVDTLHFRTCAIVGCIMMDDVKNAEEHIKLLIGELRASHNNLSSESYNFVITSLIAVVLTGNCDELIPYMRELSELVPGINGDMMEFLKHHLLIYAIESMEEEGYPEIICALIEILSEENARIEYRNEIMSIECSIIADIKGYRPILERLKCEHSDVYAMHMEFFDEVLNSNAPEKLLNQRLIKLARKNLEPDLIYADGSSQETRKPETYRRESPKIGRNEPCPCGSGKKYKKCCGA